MALSDIEFGMKHAGESDSIASRAYAILQGINAEGEKQIERGVPRADVTYAKKKKGEAVSSITRKGANVP